MGDFQLKARRGGRLFAEVSRKVRPGDAGVQSNGSRRVRIKIAVLEIPLRLSPMLMELIGEPAITG